MANTNQTMNRSHFGEVVLKIVGAVCLFMGIIFLFLGLFSSDPIALIWAIIFLPIGIYALYTAVNRQKKRELFKQYIAILNNYPDGRLDDLARHTNATVQTVTANLEWMINKNFFRNAYIDRDLQCIVINRNASTPLVDRGEFLPCTCPNCGGINRVIAGHTTECDFCGTPIRS